MYMKSLISFLLGAASVAIITTDKGKEIADKITNYVLESLKENTNDSTRSTNKQRDDI